MFQKQYGRFQGEKNFSRNMSTTFCGSPLIGMNPPTKPSLRTHLMILVPDCPITKPKLFLIPEAEHCGLNYYGFLSMTITEAKVYLGSECSVKNPYSPDSPCNGNKEVSPIKNWLNGSFLTALQNLSFFQFL